jgi:hypothetical protein
MKSLKQIFFFALKDLAIFSRQPTVLFTFILFPFLFVVLFNYVIGGVVAQDNRLEIHLATQETGSGLSRRIIDDLVTEDDSKLKPGEPKFIRESNYADALRAVGENRLKGFIAFPEDFTKGILMGYGATLKVVVNPEATDTRPALNGVAEAIAASFGLQQAARDAMSGLVVEEGLVGSGNVATAAENAQRLIAIQQGVSLRASLIKFGVEKVGETETLNPANYVIPGYLVMFVFMAAAASSAAIVLERQNNTLERLLVSSVKKGGNPGRHLRRHGRQRHCPDTYLRERRYSHLQNRPGTRPRRRAYSIVPDCSHVIGVRRDAGDAGEKPAGRRFNRRAVVAGTRSPWWLLVAALRDAALDAVRCPADAARLGEHRL